MDWENMHKFASIVYTKRDTKRDTKIEPNIFVLFYV